MKLCGNLIVIFALVVVVDYSAPLVLFVLFAVGQSFHYAHWHLLELLGGVAFFAEIEGCFGVCETLVLFFYYLLLVFWEGLSTAVGDRTDDEIMETAVKFCFVFRFGLTDLTAEFGEESIVHFHHFYN